MTIACKGVTKPRALKAQASVTKLSETSSDTSSDSSARPSRGQRLAARKAQRAVRKPVFTKRGKTWTWPDVLGLCAAARLTPHADTEAYWDKQATQKVGPASRKIKMCDGSTPKLNAIQSGATSGLKMTAGQKAAVNAKRSATRKERGYRQQHWLEAAGIKAFCSLFDTVYPNLLEFSALPDGLGADLLVKRRECVDDQWAAVQVKTAKAHPGEGMSLSVQQVDGLPGGKYEHMVILGFGLDPACERPDGATTVFDTVADAAIKDIFVYQNASHMTGQSLQPYPRQPNKQDAYGFNRYTADVDTETDLQDIMDLFVQYVDAAPKFTRHDAWFCPLLNRSVTKNHRCEVDNMKALAAVFGGVQHLRAPLAQQETVDVVLQLEDMKYRLSLKTASLDGSGGFEFKKSKAPNCHFCDGVLAFYVDRKTQERTQVSVIAAHEVYSGKGKFCWSKKNKPGVMKNRIDLRRVDTAQQIKEVLKAL